MLQTLSRTSPVGRVVGFRRSFELPACSVPLNANGREAKAQKQQRTGFRHRRRHDFARPARPA